ncbi:MAG TPA: hypothetical protein VHG29_03830 [Novosphingobium sp.]|nr:hypothetical protein [Novosphingobium sp.]
MIDRDRDPLPPETANREQDDEADQAQSVADEALDVSTSIFGLSDTEKVQNGDDSDDAQDLVDHMRQMESSGHIDMSAFRGERNDGDEEGRYGDSAEEE